MRTYEYVFTYKDNDEYGYIAAHDKQSAYEEMLFLYARFRHEMGYTMPCLIRSRLNKMITVTDDSLFSFQLRDVDEMELFQEQPITVPHSWLPGERSLNEYEEVFRPIPEKSQLPITRDMFVLLLLPMIILLILLILLIQTFWPS